MSDEAAAGEDPERATDAGARDGGLAALDAGDALRYLQWGALAALVVFALVGAVGVYTGVDRTIGLWVDRRYRPLVSAAWNLAVLLASLSGIVVLLRRLR